ncbi:PT domain-containing protein, partial [Limosilactobacillus reuteri]|uniref:mucin-binding protein n=2 Tax=Limosilactobacillus reuteri TaxID=1598 RepID=UPI00254EF209
MSKNNVQEYVRKMEPQRQRFGLRKLSVGVASILLGTTFIVGGTVAHADSTPTTQEATTANTDITQPVSTSVVQADKQTNGEQNLVENTSSNSQKEQQLVNKTSNESTDQLNNEKNQELVKDNKYESVTNLNNNNVNTQNTPVEESKVSQSATEQDATIDLTFVDDDDNGKIVDYSEYLPSENGGHHYAYGKIGDKVSAKAYNNGKMSIQRMLDLLDVGYYELNGPYTAPDTFTSKNMSVQIHLKHQTEQRKYAPITLIRNIHYRHTMATDGKTMQDDQGNEVPDRIVQYRITPIVDYDLVMSRPAGGTFKVENLTTGETYTIASQNNRLVVDNFDPIMSPDVSYQWKPQAVETTESFDKLPDLDHWKSLANGNISDDQSVVYKVDYTKIKIGDYVPNNEIYYNTDIEQSADGTKETVYRYFYYGMTDENDEGVNTDHVTKQHYGGRQALEFTRTKTVNTNGEVIYGEWQPITTDTFPEYIYKDKYQIKGYDGQFASAPAVKYNANTEGQDGGMSVFDPYGPLYKVSIIDDVTGETLNTYEKNPVPEAGDDYQYTRDRAEKTRQSIYDQVDKYKSKGYTVASDDFGSISINNADNAKHSEGTEDDAKYVYTIHLTTNKAIAHTDTKTATRTIHYVANDENGKQLQDDTTQNVTLTSSTYYTDAVTGQKVNARQNVNGEWFVDALNNGMLPAITWTVNADKSTGLTVNDQKFAAVTTPETITLSTDEAAKRGTDDGEWYLVSTDKNGEVSYGDPNSDNWQTDTTNKIADGYLVYKQKAQYNIHYIDVNGVEDKTTYAPTDGHELTNHLVPNVGEGKGIFVGDTPDATAKLWSPADYEKAGYVLVGLSDNAKGDLLGKQTLTKGVQDQYVYLKHQVVEVTPHTPDGDIPSDPKDPSKPSVDKNELSKNYTRNIYYKANTADGPTLKDQTTQKVTFEASVYVDKVTHETSGVETVTDANGKQVQVANGQPGKITWNKTIVDGDATKLTDTSARFNSVDQPTIDLEKGNKYATSDDMTGTWYLVDGEANELDLTPDSSNPVDKTLVYKQKAQYNIHYIDVNGVEDKTTYVSTDGHELDDHKVNGVGSDEAGKTYYVGDTPDATSKLWSPADYEKAGYVLVGLSDNAKGDLLGKQTLTKGVQDQYVYLKHAVKDITPNTPVDDVPKDPEDNPIVDPSDLHKEFHRTIFYKANTTDGQTLMGQTDQKTEFNGTIAYDVVTGKTTTPETVKDVNGKDVQVATLKDGIITWDKQNDKFSAINQPTIELKKGDKYATSDDMVGTWELVDGEAGEVDLTPASKNPEDKTLVYKQKAQYNIHYIDVNGVEDKNTYAPTDGKELTDHLVPNVGEGKGIFIGDTPDATAKLWSPADYEKAGYVLVGLSDNAKGDLLGKQTLTKATQDQYVYLKHAVKDITPNTPASEVPKDPDGKRAIDPSDLHKEFTRNITFVANNDAKSPLKDSIPQKVEFDGHIYVDMVTGQTTTPETVKDANGKNIQVATTKAGNIEWNHDTQTMDEVVRKYITLNKGDKYATSDDMVGTWHWISGTADEITLKPTSTNPEDLVLVYEKNKSESGPDEDHDLPKVDVKQETKTFTRTVVYRGTKDGGVHFESVNGSPDGKNTYKQSVTFTRSIFSTTDKDGKVTILKTAPWTAKDDTLGEVVSKTPSEVGYELVDIEKVDAYKINPNTDPEDLGETIVTYSMKPKHETGPDEDHDLPKVDVKQETKTFTRTVVYRGTKDGGVHFESVDGSPDGKNTYKQTVTFTRSVSSTTDKDGKVTILETTPWTAKDDTLGEVVSKTPSAVGYEVVDIDKVDSYKINPDKDNPDLGIVTVTYEATPTQPTEQPTSQPTAQPTEQPTSQPTAQPTEQPTSQPTAQPTEQPTSQPTAQPTKQPTSQPTAQPTEQPTSQPTVQPTEQPTSQPTAQPTEQPTSQPTAQPTEQPTSQPTAQPTEQPTSQPTVQPTEQP